MGLRKAQASQPSKLKNPVPEVGTDEVPAGENISFTEPLDVLAERAPSAVDFAQLGKQAAQGQQAEVVVDPSTVVPQEPQQPPVDFAALGREALANDIDSDEADWWPRIKASFAITPRQEISIYRSHYGPENVQVNEKNEILVKKPGAKEFVPADNQFASNLKDILGDGAGFAFRALTQQITEATSARLGASAGLPLGAAGSLTTGAVGAGAGMVASPAVADFASGKIAQMFGAEEEAIDLKNKLLVDGLMNLATAGAMKFVGTNIRNAVSQSPLNRIGALAGVRKSVESWIDRFGSRDQLPSDLGGKVVSKLEDLREQYGRSVGALNSAAINRAKELSRLSNVRDAQPVDNAISKIKEVILEYGGSLNPNDRSLFPFGKVEGAAALKELDGILFNLEAYKKVGGLPMKELIDYTSTLQQMSKFNEKTKLPENILKAYKSVAESFARDRNAAFERLLKGTPQESILKSMPYKKFEMFKEDVGSLLKSYNSNKNPELFAEALIQRNNSESYLGLVRALGKDNPMVGDIKAAWLTKILDDSIDSTSGILNAKKFVDTIESYGKSVVKEVIGFDELNKLKMLAQRASKISQSGIKTDDTGTAISGLLRDVARIGTYGTTVPVAFGNLIFRLTKGNAKAVDYIANKGWYDAVESLPLEKQAAMMEAYDSFRAAMAGAKRQVLPNGMERYVVTGLPRSKGEAAANLSRFMFQQGVVQPSSNGSFPIEKE